MLRLGTSQRCQELEGHAPVSRKHLSRNRAHLSPRVSCFPKHTLGRAQALRLLGAIPLVPPKFLAFLLRGQRHNVSDPIQPKNLKAHFGEGDAAKARMELPPACRDGWSGVSRC